MNRLVLWLLFCFQSSFIDLNFMAEKEGFEPSRRYSRPTPFPGEPLQPLGYFSMWFLSSLRLNLTQRLGFEPREVLPSPVFKTGALNQLDHLCIFIYSSFRRNRLLRYYTKHLFLSTTFPKKLFSNLRTNFLSNLLPSLVLI